jgi:hypothetical protein
MLPDHFGPSFESIHVHCDRSPNEAENDIAKEALESRNIGVSKRKLLRRGVCANYAQRKDLSVGLISR